MKVVVVLFSIAAAVSVAGDTDNQGWELWKKPRLVRKESGQTRIGDRFFRSHKEHGKQYEDTATEMHRYAVWKSNLASIEEHNKKADQLGYTLAMNQFGDLTDTEFNDKYNGFKMDNQHLKKSNEIVFIPSADYVASNGTTAVDWREQGVVTPVKNQGDCGSCWAFSATGSLEAQHNLSGHPLVSLSEQNIMDCSQGVPYSNMACLGGLMTKAFQYIIDNKGVDTEASYPYLAQTETKCRFNPSNVGATMSSYVNVQINEMALTEACEKIGPISVAIDASLTSFHFYKSGVYYEPQCSTTKLNHGVLVVGYGTDETPFYLVKNSWGDQWGLQGYIKMSRYRDNNCGIATVASYPVV